MPRLDFAFLADAAEAVAGSKLYVLGGGIDTIGAHAFPTAHPHMSLVVRIMVHPTEADRVHRLEIRLMDSDGGELAHLDGQFTASQGGPPGRETPVNIVLNMVNVVFAHPGDYSVELLVDDQHVKSLPLHLHEVPSPPGLPNMPQSPN